MPRRPPAQAPLARRAQSLAIDSTPANWLLTDRDGERLLGLQGGCQPPGLDDMPDMTARGWVETNGPHGHGCACLTVTTDASSRRVTRILSARPVRLNQCRADPRLPRL